MKDATSRRATSDAECFDRALSENDLRLYRAFGQWVVTSIQGISSLDALLLTVLGIEADQQLRFLRPGPPLRRVHRALRMRTWAVFCCAFPGCVPSTDAQWRELLAVQDAWMEGASRSVRGHAPRPELDALWERAFIEGDYLEMWRERMVCGFLSLIDGERMEPFDTQIPRLRSGIPARLPRWYLDTLRNDRDLRHEVDVLRATHTDADMRLLVVGPRRTFEIGPRQLSSELRDALKLRRGQLEWPAHEPHDAGLFVAPDGDSAISGIEARDLLERVERFVSLRLRYDRLGRCNRIVLENLPRLLMEFVTQAELANQHRLDPGLVSRVLAKEMAWIKSKTNAA